jgi:hypothetical protein
MTAFARDPGRPAGAHPLGRRRGDDEAGRAGDPRGRRRRYAKGHLSGAVVLGRRVHTAGRAVAPGAKQPPDHGRRRLPLALRKQAPRRASHHQKQGPPSCHSEHDRRRPWLAVRHGRADRRKLDRELDDVGVSKAIVRRRRASDASSWAEAAARCRGADDRSARPFVRQERLLSGSGTRLSSTFASAALVAASRLAEHHARSPVATTTPSWRRPTSTTPADAAVGRCPRDDSSSSAAAASIGARCQ